MYKIYVKVDRDNRIIAVNSSAFLNDIEGWIEIDKGSGDRYYHAQGNYLKDLVDNRGLHRYKLQGGKVMERTEEEMSADYKPPVIMPTVEERLETLEKAFTVIQALVKGLNK